MDFMEISKTFVEKLTPFYQESKGFIPYILFFSYISTLVNFLYKNNKLFSYKRIKNMKYAFFFGFFMFVHILAHSNPAVGILINLFTFSFLLLICLLLTLEHNDEDKIETNNGSNTFGYLDGTKIFQRPKSEETSVKTQETPEITDQKTINNDLTKLTDEEKRLRLEKRERKVSKEISSNIYFIFMVWSTMYVKNEYLPFYSVFVLFVSIFIMFLTSKKKKLVK
jgi:hypothetical protein